MAKPAALEFPAEPFANFADSRQRAAFTGALGDVGRELGARYPLLIAGEEVRTQQWLASVNPAHPAQVVGHAAQAGGAEMERAVAAAEHAQPRWAATPVDERIASLRKAAGLLRERRWWFAALAVLEVGKPWREADADVVEAVEYLDYYAAAMEQVAAGKAVLQRPGEANQYRYVPRGVCAVIAPWNFPVAILTGMASAALVTGNVVILKPAEQSPVLAYHLTRLLHEAGIPADAVQYLPGLGEDIGAGLVRHPKVRLILFTGSKAVGLSILQAVGQPEPGQRFLKHAVVEMGGKNAVIVDEDADLDAAIKGALVSAFSYGGQKCSAASRLIIHEAVYDRLIPRLTKAVEGLRIGDPASPDCELGPLIDEEAVRRVTAAIAQGGRSATLLYQCPSGRLPQEGYFMGPALFADVDRASALAQQELFGPVLSLFRVRSFEEALELANDVDYGLTGGVYSRSPSHLQHAIEAFEVGNLYLNRPITGALVGRQPFGGYKLSGLGTKAGGPDYLLQLMIPKTICENTARHGMPLE
ncbi:MAG: L-glutamate gamma-semialdehyde dehydrogenase [Candidatus Omnitrophica bacterium]|nr:L-glutamate gamma-semialdehyde dehydrogenase [Candidatus Omnitrophota bacterium]